jgi:hypothetical protein
MTTEQFFLILGTIYIAPTVSPIFANVAGFGFLILAACKKLGLI